MDPESDAQVLSTVSRPRLGPCVCVRAHVCVAVSVRVRVHTRVRVGACVCVQNRGGHVACHNGTNQATKLSQRLKDNSPYVWPSGVEAALMGTVPLHPTPLPF